ncbi:MAG: hypothetical protein A2X99_10845 [Deltaproteobacteria bacterium GWB2_55_19]|nr:MAG: hypothetical protein A2X99_10845 [Deltaproteobacteria bacterium GWB2_55_19]
MMDNSTKQLIEDCASTDARFYKALTLIQKWRESSNTSNSNLVIAITKEMIRCGKMPERRQDERLTALIHKLNLTLNDREELSHSAVVLPLSLQNTISKFLSPSQRLHLLSKEKIPQKKESDSASASPVIVQSTEFPSAPVLSGAINLTEQRCSTVLLLSKIGNQDKNKKLLEENGFGPILYNSFEKLRKDLESGTDICACLIDGSFLKDMSKEEQINFLEELARHSTFMWIRIDGSSLKVDHSYAIKIIKDAQCKKILPAENMSIPSDGDLREPELSFVKRARDLLQTHQGTHIVQKEITENIGRVLIAAVREHAQELRHDGLLKVHSIETKFLVGGYSGAQIALIRVNREGNCVVAKIDKKDRILDEMKRYRCFIQAWDDRLQARACFHGDTAVILFILVSDRANMVTPAPVLEECLEEVWNNEIFGSLDKKELDRKADNLCDGLDKITLAICELNKNKSIVPEFECYGNPSMDIFRTLDKNFNWGLNAEHRKARDLAEEQFQKLASAAIVHGDMHLRNILVRSDIDMHLIDFAASGPGHPAVDLARLELALFLGCFRPLEEESVYVEFQKAITFELASKDELEKRFPGSFRSSINHVCLKGCVAARDQAIEALKMHGGSEKDYIAAKYLLAWQNLLMPGRQTSLTRSVILTLAPQIISWSS